MLGNSWRISNYAKFSSPKLCLVVVILNMCEQFSQSRDCQPTIDAGISHFYLVVLDLDQNWLNSISGEIVVGEFQPNSFANSKQLSEGQKGETLHLNNEKGLDLAIIEKYLLVKKTFSHQQSTNQTKQGHWR